MVLGGPTAANRLVDLRFQSLKHLKEASELLVKNRVTINRLASIKAFGHVERLFDEGKLHLRDGDEEQAYLLFTRMGTIADLIIHKNDFAQFKNTPDGRRFYDLFEQCINNLSDLEESLTKRYELIQVGKRYERDVSECVDSKTVVDRQNDIPDGSLAIDPRDVMRHVESNHQVLLIDYRNDQSEIVKCTSTGRLLVAQIPSETVVPGCIGSSLIRSVAISERVLLQRMADVDLVVLMGTDSAPNNQGEMIAGSKEQILHSALSTYNNNFQPRRPPLFIKGGFENWRLCYPMHTTAKSIQPRTFNFSNRTEFAQAVANYKKDVGIDSLEYPELLPRERMEPKAKPLEATIATIPANLPQASASDSAVYSLAQSTSHPVMPSLSSQSDQSTNYGSNAAANDTVGREIISKKSLNLAAPVEPVVCTLPSVPSREVKAKVDNLEAKPPPIPQHRSLPIIDRSKKPTVEMARPIDQIRITVSPQTVGGAKILFDGTVQPAVPKIPDRNTKPQLIERGDDARWLQVLYESMIKTINDSAIRRSCNPGYTGLYNLGNTCFMNATLQALFNTTALRKIFTNNCFIGHVNRVNKMGTFGVISSAFSALMDAVWSGAYSVIRPQQFLETFASEVNASLADHQQHDAQEFQIYLLDALHEDTNRTQKRIPFQQDYTGENIMAEAADYAEKLRQFGTSPVNDIFSCQTVSHLRCNSCDAQSVTFEEMTQLSIEVPTRNTLAIGECLRAHFRPVILDGSCKWHCPRCKSLRIATRTTFIWKLPRVLMLHMKRFTFAENGWRKNDAYVKFDTLPLDLSSFMHPVLQNSARTQNKFFTLYAVINHSGSLNSGHYTALARNDETKEWLHFDDDAVSTISVDSVCSRNAFILYYKQDM